MCLKLRFITQTVIDKAARGMRLAPHTFKPDNSITQAHSTTCTPTRSANKTIIHVNSNTDIKEILRQSLVLSP